MLSFHQIDKFWVKSVHFWGVTENVEPPIFHWKIKTVPAVSLSSPDELDKYHYNIYLREKWHLPASLAPGCITQPPFCLHFRWKYLHCWTEELELRQWILILLLPQDKPAVPCAVEKADCATPAEGWRWSHHLLISQSWPVESAWNRMSHQTQPWQKQAAVEREVVVWEEPTNGSWATSLSQGEHHVSLGHPESPKDVSILTRRRILTW